MDWYVIFFLKYTEEIDYHYKNQLVWAKPRFALVYINNWNMDRQYGYGHSVSFAAFLKIEDYSFLGFDSILFCLEQRNEYGLSSIGIVLTNS